jgi:hypothetical protein
LNAAGDMQSLTPLQRLLQSRERLRAALAAVPEPATAASAKAEGAAWQASLMAAPGASIVKDALQSWWAGHPLRAAALVAQGAGNALMKPAAEKHPFFLVAGALLVGAALVRLKPWRWGFKKALLAGLLPQLISKVVSEMPVSAWMAVVSQLVQERHERSQVKTTVDTER